MNRITILFIEKCLVAIEDCWKEKKNVVKENWGTAFNYWGLTTRKFYAMNNNGHPNAPIYIHFDTIWKLSTLQTIGEFNCTPADHSFTYYSGEDSSYSLLITTITNKRQIRFEHGTWRRSDQCAPSRIESYFTYSTIEKVQLYILDLGRHGIYPIYDVYITT